jgi:hypothetical protein
MAIHKIGQSEGFEFANDPIVIRVYGKSIINGRVLDTTGYTEEWIRKGQLVIRDEANGISKPMPVSNGAYGELPSGYVYEGVAKATVPASEPWVGVMYEGEVNDVASPYPLTSSMLAALKTALPELAFKHS